MRVWMTIGCLAIILCGCEHFSSLGPADFERGRASKVQFARDNYDCETNAIVEQNMVGGGDPRGVYNDAYTACMAKLGYPVRSVDMLGIGG